MPEPTEILQQVLSGASLSEVEAEDAFERILTGRFDEAQIGALLALITVRGPTVDELVGGARAMRRHVERVNCPSGDARVLLDTCGTGGAPKTFNVSTVSAIVTAAAAPEGVMVAKHGSRSRTGRGSAEVMSQLGVNIDAPSAVQTRCLAEAGVCFSFAINHHPAMKYAAGPRKSLGFPTIFNLLGPLTNPAAAPRQLLGAYDRTLALKLAETLARLGVDRAMVVTSHDGLDELTTTNTNAAHEVVEGAIATRVIDASRLGLSRATVDSLKASDLDHAVDIISAVLDGATGPHRDLVLLNTAAALRVAGACEDLEEGVERSAEAIDRGDAKRTLVLLARISNEA